MYKILLVKNSPAEADEASMYAVDPDDGTPAFLVGEVAELRDLHKRIGKFLRDQQVDEEVSHLDERIGVKWITVPKAVELAAEVGRPTTGRTVRWACVNDPALSAVAERQGRDWRFPQLRFLGWLRTERRPGPKAARNE